MKAALRFEKKRAINSNDTCASADIEEKNVNGMQM